MALKTLWLQALQRARHSPGLLPAKRASSSVMGPE
jgi:hypothetical protein